tara:strand:- start:139 stop:732 length:594 start_codon:yes stop_codon:yes gene_type:complete
MNTPLIMNKFALYQAVLTAYLHNEDLESEMSKHLLLCYMFGVFFAVASDDEDFFYNYKGYVNKTNSEDADLEIVGHVFGFLRNIFLSSERLSAQGFVQSSDAGIDGLGIDRKLKIEYSTRDVGLVFVKFVQGGIPFGDSGHGFSELEYSFVANGLKAGRFFSDPEGYKKQNIDTFEEPYEFAISLHKGLNKIYQIQN